jgi:hypothetical protein
MLSGFFWGWVMLEIAGLVVSAVGLAIDLGARFTDWVKWDEGDDLLVDGDWLAVAISKGVLDGGENDYGWSSENKVATRLLKGTHSVVMAADEDKKMKYRIVRGREGERLVLLKRLEE